MSDFYNKYPYTDFHELNLDWVIERVKKLTEDWAATLEEWNSTEEQWQELYDYVHDYFDNLDVQQEINNKINAMIADGTFVTITTPVIEAKVASMMPATVAAQIGATVASQIGATVASQIDDTVAGQIGAAVVTPVDNWLSTHITQPTTPVVDDTLSIKGAAADAQETGYRINEINAALDRLDFVDSDNKWNPDYQALNKIVNNSPDYYGELSDQAGYTTSYFIPAVQGNIVNYGFSDSPVYDGIAITNSANAYRIAEYDADKNCLVVTASWISLPYIVQNAGTRYIRISVASHAHNCVIFGTITGDMIYETYGKKSNVINDMGNTLHSVIDDTINFNNQSINWFNPEEAEPFAAGTILVWKTGQIPVTPGEVLYASKSFNSYSANTMEVDSFYIIQCYDANGYNHDHSGYWVTSYTIPADTVYVICYIGNYNNAKQMIEKDVQTLVWTPYVKEGYSAVDQPARDAIEHYPGYLYDCVSVFDRIAGVGDSFTAGYAKSSGAEYNTDINHTYVGVMANRCGIDFAIYAQSGATTRSYITDKLPALLADSTCDFYFLALGINDVGLGLSYIGSVSDIHDGDPASNPDTFFGNYGKIIEAIKNHAPKALFTLIQIPICGSNVKQFDAAIAEIGEHYGIPVINPYDDEFFKSALYEQTFNDGHPTLIGYTGMALAYERLLGKAMHDNPIYFKYATLG